MYANGTFRTEKNKIKTDAGWLDKTAPLFNVYLRKKCQVKISAWPMVAENCLKIPSTPPTLQITNDHTRFPLYSTRIKDVNAARLTVK